MRLVKGDSSEFINKQKLVIGKFQWRMVMELLVIVIRK